jgi:hypothetical protein
MSIIYINPFQFAAAGPAFLLDDYPGAAAAYSLRQLRTGVTNVVRVRRDNDDVEADFTATEVSDGTLAAWVGAGNNGFVRTWYDQSGNANDATQTATASQPRIVNSGVVVLSGAKASMSFDGSDDALNLPTLSSNAQLFAFSVISDLTYVGTSANARLFDVLAGSYSFQTLRDGASNDFHMKNSSWQTGNIATRFNAVPTALSLASNWFDSSSNSYWLNGSSISSVANPGVVGASGTIGRIGARADLVSSTFLNGRYAELLLYQSDQSSNRVAIEADINAHYSIYP